MRMLYDVLVFKWQHAEAKGGRSEFSHIWFNSSEAAVLKHCFLLRSLSRIGCCSDSGQGRAWTHAWTKALGSALRTAYDASDE